MLLGFEIFSEQYPNYKPIVFKTEKTSELILI